MPVAKILFVIYSEKQKRTFIETGFAASVENLVEFNILNTTNKPLFQTSPNSNPINFRIPSLLSRSGTLLAVSYLWKNRNKTPAHRLRAYSSFARKKMRPKHEGMILYHMSDWSELKRTFVRLISLPILWNTLATIRNFLVLITFSFMLRKMKIRFSDYTAVCIPYSGQLSSEFDDFVNYFQTQGLLTIGIQENWDNLSTKTFTIAKPNYFLVWGKQSEGHLRVVHHNYSSICEIIGTPRFIPYFDASNEVSSRVISNLGIKRPYILVTGTGDGIDDFQILSKSIEVLQDLHKSDRVLSVDLVYRPHPFTRNSLSDLETDFLSKSSVLIDNRRDSHGVFYHCPLIQNAILVINQFSTILLEALSVNNKVLLPTFVNRPVNYGYRQSINEWYHLIGLESFPNVFFSHDQAHFSRDLIAALEAKSVNSRIHSRWMCLDENANLRFRQFLSERIIQGKKV